MARAFPSVRTLQLCGGTVLEESSLAGVFPCLTTLSLSDGIALFAESEDTYHIDHLILYNSDESMLDELPWTVRRLTYLAQNPFNTEEEIVFSNIVDKGVLVCLTIASMHEDPIGAVWDALWATNLTVRLLEIESTMGISLEHLVQCLVSGDIPCAAQHPY